MAINLQNTNTVSASSIKMLVYGQAGSGKTSLIPTMPKPVILSAEGGLLSIAGSDGGGHSVISRFAEARPDDGQAGKISGRNGSDALQPINAGKQNRAIAAVLL